MLVDILSLEDGRDPFLDMPQWCLKDAFASVPALHEAGTG
jgi:hypothetical protein